MVLVIVVAAIPARRNRPAHGQDGRVGGRGFAGQVNSHRGIRILSNVNPMSIGDLTG